jgi:hypothetical protein
MLRPSTRTTGVTPPRVPVTLGGVDLGQREVAFVRRAAGSAPGLDHAGLGDALEAVGAGAGPERAAAHDEEVGRVAAGDEAARVQHQRLVGAGGDGLDQGLDQVEPAVRIEPQVEHVGSAGAEGGGEQAQPARLALGPRRLVLRGDDDGGAADHEARILVDGGLDAARDHQPQVDTLSFDTVHAVGGQRGVQRVGDLLPRQTDVQRDRARALEQAVQVGVQTDEPAAHQAQALPHAVAEREAAVEHRDPGLVARHELAIDVDEHLLVAGVGYIALGAARGVHGARL